ncbi:MAG: carboxypeptidase-like regulatory domain-containing protein [Thermodesulfovibrionales bacterium]
MRKILLIFILTSLVMSATSCYGFAVIRKDGPYEGRVIDADTGEPIEGVVVLGKWSTEIITPGGATHNFYDAQETVTDKNGEFSIEGLGLKILSNVIPMDVLIFKAGYEYESGSWSSLKKYAKKIKWEGNKAIIPLRKLTMEERRKRRPPIPPTEAPLKKIRLMLEEINKNEIELGAEPYDIWGGEKVYEKNAR